MSGTILRRRDRTARPPRVEHYSSAVNNDLRADLAAAVCARRRRASATACSSLFALFLALVFRRMDRLPTT